MITPTVGRVVWVRQPHDVQPNAALITHVVDDTTVNVVVFTPGGSSYALHSAHLKQSDDESPPLPYVEWMPYQKGQAAKTEALEAHAAMRRA